MTNIGRIGFDPGRVTATSAQEPEAFTVGSNRQFLAAVAIEPTGVSRLRDEVSGRH